MTDIDAQGPAKAGVADSARETALAVARVDWKPVAEELRRVLATVKPEAAPKSRFIQFWTVLSSPFIVTLLGGIALAIITHTWQAAVDARVRDAQELKARREALYEFIGHFSRSSSVLRDMTRRALWLRFQRDAGTRPLLGVISKDKEPLYYDGLNSAETHTALQRMNDKYYESGETTALCQRMRGECRTSSLREQFRKLDEATNTMCDSSGNEYTFPSPDDTLDQLESKLKYELTILDKRFTTVLTLYDSAVGQYMTEIISSSDEPGGTK